MVHSKPEYAESVKLLTYSQLRKLEKIDAKKERDRQILQGFTGAGTAAIYELGEFLKTAVKGVFDVEAAIAGNSDPIAQGVAIGAQAVAFGYFTSTPLGQWIFQTLGLEVNFKGSSPPAPTPPGMGSQPNPKTPLGGANPDKNYTYVVTFTYFNPFDYKWDANGREAFQTADERQAWITEQGSRIRNVQLSMVPT